MSRYRRSRWGRLLAALMLAAAFLLRWYLGPQFDSPSRRDGTRERGLSPGVYAVERVVDGDTLLLTDGHVRVRLQGIDAPEIANEEHPAEPWAGEATTLARRFVRDAGGRVRLEVDGESTDQFGRSLAFVWNGDRLLNEELVRAGLAQARLGYRYSQAKKDRLRDAQRQAQRASRGQWSER